MSAPSGEEWETGVVPDEIRLGLSRQEFQDVRDKYDVVVATTILATPILDATGPDTTVCSTCSTQRPRACWWPVVTGIGRASATAGRGRRPPVSGRRRP